LNADPGPLAAGVAAWDKPLLRERLGEVRRECPGLEASALAELGVIVEDDARSQELLRDALSTRLMEVFRVHRSRAAFGLLYELNRAHLLQQVASRLRRYQSHSDPQDVLQEVFFNVYRYPHRFDAGRADAFRVWSATIVRNTVLKHLRSLSRSGRAEVPFEDLPEQPEEPGKHEPVSGAIEDESRLACTRVYMTYLHLYLRFYTMLSERERRAIHLVEVDELSYRDAAGALGIKLENLKMVIFRARRKIHRSMRRVFEGLPPDCKPAREPRPRSQASETDPLPDALKAKDGVR
jgi:RNA polymerase sigma-70 factor (ECF subfamily)